MDISPFESIFPRIDRNPKTKNCTTDRSARFDFFMMNIHTSH